MRRVLFIFATVGVLHTQASIAHEESFIRNTHTPPVPGPKEPYSDRLWHPSKHKRDDLADKLFGSVLEHTGTVGPMFHPPTQINTLFNGLFECVMEYRKQKSKEPRSRQATKKEIHHLVTQLGNREYWPRERAHQELMRIGYNAFKQLHAAAKGKNPEVRWRAKDILKKVNKKYRDLKYCFSSSIDEYYRPYYSARYNLDSPLGCPDVTLKQTEVPSPDISPVPVEILPKVLDELPKDLFKEFPAEIDHYLLFRFKDPSPQWLLERALTDLDGKRDHISLEKNLHKHYKDLTKCMSEKKKNPLADERCLQKATIGFAEKVASIIFPNQPMRLCSEKKK